MGKTSDTAAIGSNTMSVSSKAPTSEQLRIAQLLEDPKTEDHSVTKDKVCQVMELTRCSETEALAALHDCDNDIHSAVDRLCDGGDQGVWVIKEGRKSKRAQSSQQSTKENHAADGVVDSYENHTNGPSSGRTGRGGGRGAVITGGDAPPRFRGRGGVKPVRKPGKENDLVDQSDRGDRGRFRGRGRGGRDIERGGRGRPGFAARGGRRGGHKSRDGNLEQIDNWNASDADNNTWDNSMANTWSGGGGGGGNGGGVNAGGAPGNGGSGDNWKGVQNSDTWDNSMAQTTFRPGKDQQQRPNEWNNVEDWGGEEDWDKLRDGLVVESRNPQKLPASTVPSASAAAAPPNAAPNSRPNIPVSQAPTSSAGQVRGASSQSQGKDTNTTSAAWAAKQATTDLKNELGIGKPASVVIPGNVNQNRPRQQLPSKMQAAKVEFQTGSSMIAGPIDVQFGDMTINSDSQPLFDFVFSQPTFSSVPSQSKDPNAVRQSQMLGSNNTFQRTPAKEQQTNADLIKTGDTSSSVDQLISSYQTSTVTTQNFAPSTEQQQFPSRTTSVVNQMASATPSKNMAGASSIGNSQQRNVMFVNNVASASSDSVAQQSAKDSMIQASMPPLHSVAPTQNAVPNAGLGMASVNQSRSPATSTTGSKTQVSSNLSINQMAPYPPMAAGLSQYMGFDQFSMNQLNYLAAPPNMLLNHGGFDMRALGQVPSLSGTNVNAGRDSGDMKGQIVRQDAGSNMPTATAGSLSNLSVPPPGLPAPTVSNAEHAAHLLNMAAAGMYTLPLYNSPFLAATQFVVPSVSTASPVTSGNQYQRPTAYAPPLNMFSAGGYEDIQLAADYNKPNYNVIQATVQTKGISSAGAQMNLTGNDANSKSYGGGLKGGYDSKSFAPATGTPPPLSNINYSAAFQNSGNAAAPYCYPSYLPSVNVMPSPMAPAMASNNQLSNDLGGSANQRGVNQSTKVGGSTIGKNAPQYPYAGSWGN